MKIIKFSVIILSLFLLAVEPVSAGPIYVFKEADGSIKFTNRTPPKNTTYKVFTASKPNFSVYKAGAYRSRGTGKLNKNAYNDIIREVASETSLEPSLIKAVIHVESAFNHRAVSPKGARGLMQLMPGTARDLGVKNSFHAEENISGGSRHLARLLVKYKGNLKFALAAYNAGEEAVQRYNGIPPYSETRAYVRRVLELKERYRTAV